MAFFMAKGLKPTFAWQDMIGEEHHNAFTVAKMLEIDLLTDVRDLLDTAIAEGQSMSWFRGQLEPMLIERGWWGRQKVVDPATGQEVEAQLGSMHRLETIFRTNMQSAYSAGEWQAIQDQSADAPYLMYDAVDDYRTRETHKKLDELVLPVNSPFWQTHYPPNGWNCRCGVIQLDEDDFKAIGKKNPDEEPVIQWREWKNPRTGNMERIPADIDPGWGTNAGITRRQDLDRLIQEKIDALPPDMRAAAKGI